MTPRARPLRGPTLWFVLVAAAVHVVRQNLVDVVVFVGTAVLILVDASRPWRDRTTPLVRLTPAVAGWVCLAYAAVLLPLSRTGGGWSGPRSWSRCACSRSSTSSTSPTPRPTAARTRP